MRPSFPVDNLAYSTTAYAIHFSNFSLRVGGVEGADFKNILLRKLGKAVPFATIVRAMFDSVGHIFFNCCPSYMPPADTAKVSIPTGMCGGMSLCRWGTMLGLAGHAMYELLSVACVYIGVTHIVAIEWPVQTFLAGIRKNNILKVFLSNPIAYAPGGWATVCIPALVVCGTPTALQGRFSAVGDGASLEHGGSLWH